MKKSTAHIIHEYGPFPETSSVHGVSYDGRHVWFATGDKLLELDPSSGKTLRSIDVPANAGTAFDGRHLYQVDSDRIQKIDPDTGRFWARFPCPTTAARRALPGAKACFGPAATRTARSIKSIPTPGRCFASWSPIAS